MGVFRGVLYEGFLRAPSAARDAVVAREILDGAHVFKARRRKHGAHGLSLIVAVLK